MIKKEFYKTREDGVDLYRNYSDEGYVIKQVETEILYNEAIDVENAPYTYGETDILINNGDATEEDYENALSELGVSE